MTEYVRRIDKLGRIVIPMEYRKRVGLEIDDEASIIEENGKIVIQKKTPSCKICGSDENLNEEFSLCQKCIDKIKNA